MLVRYDVDIKSIMPEGGYLLLFVMTSVFYFFLTYHFDLVSQHGSITLLGFDRGITWITLINNIITIIFPLGGM